MLGTIQINCNYRGRATDTPFVHSDIGHDYPGVFDPQYPDSRVIFSMPAQTPPQGPSGWGGSVNWANQSVRIVLQDHAGKPLGPGSYEGASIGFPEMLEYAPPIPPTPGRETVCGVNITFQGLMVQTQQYGLLPWFDAALFSLTPEDRQAVYAAKKATNHDTHCILGFDHNAGSIYDEPGQPYQQMNGRAFQDHISEFQAAVIEVIEAGFTPMVFLGGDDGERGFPIAMQALPELIQALRITAAGDVVPYVLVLPGWDGVWYGYTADHIADLGQRFRILAPDGYLGIEFQPGLCHLGGGVSDWGLTGRMQFYDVLLLELNFPHWPESDPNYDDDMQNVWQVGSRLLGPHYTGPQGGAPWYWQQPSPRGPYYACAFEWVGEYYFVRGQQTVAEQTRSRAYLESLGYRYTG